MLIRSSIPIWSLPYNLIDNWKTYQIPGQGGNSGIKFTNLREYEYEEYHNQDGDEDNKDDQVPVQNQGKEEKAIYEIKFDIKKIICYNCGLTVNFSSVCTNVANPERVKKATAARDKEKEYNEDCDIHFLWSSFDDRKFYNTEYAQFTFFSNSGICRKQDVGDDEVNYQHVM